MEQSDKNKNELIDLQSQIDSVNEERLTLQNNLSSIKIRLSQGIVPNKLYAKLMEAKLEYHKAVQDNLKIHRVLKRRKGKINDIIEDERNASRNSPEKINSVKSELEGIKNKYFEFYRDKTRISGMRKMASDFIIELDKVIKKL